MNCFGANDDGNTTAPWTFPEHGPRVFGAPRTRVPTLPACANLYLIAAREFTPPRRYRLLCAAEPRHRLLRREAGRHVRTPLSPLPPIVDDATSPGGPFVSRQMPPLPPPCAPFPHLPSCPAARPACLTALHSDCPRAARLKYSLARPLGTTSAARWPSSPPRRSRLPCPWSSRSSSSCSR